jgi:hypothetical protein
VDAVIHLCDQVVDTIEYDMEKGYLVDPEIHFTRAVIDSPIKHVLHSEYAVNETRLSEDHRKGAKSCTVVKLNQGGKLFHNWTKKQRQ